MEVGDIVEIEVTRVGEWGLYGTTAGGEVGFVDAMEISWTGPAVTKGIEVGDRLEVRVAKLFDEALGPYQATFVASVRRVHPERNPWADPSIYQIGAVFPAVVERYGAFYLFLRLETGAEALVHPDNWPEERPLEGGSVVARLVSVNVKNQSLWVVLQ